MKGREIGRAMNNVFVLYATTAMIVGVGLSGMVVSAEFSTREIVRPQQMLRKSDSPSFKCPKILDDICCGGDEPPHPIPIHTNPVPEDGPYPSRMSIDALPGLEDLGEYAYFSGYLDAGVPPSGKGKMYFHYICAMSPNWEEKPLTIWYNGGPGAPSTYGLFQEFGPFLLTDESLGTEGYAATGVPTPIYNPWTWANETSLCEIDSPAPMGASFCTEGNGTAGSTGGPGGNAYECGPWTDTTVAEANHRAHVAFFNEAFPEFEKSQQPVYLTGESYAGVYVPLFVDQWLDDPVRGPNGDTINFQGFAVGDGFAACVPVEGKKVDWCVDLNNVGFFEYPNALAGPWWDLNFFHGHSQMSEALYREVLETCTENELKGIDMPLSSACASIMRDRVANEVGFFYAYNVYQACPSQVPSFSTSHRLTTGNAGRRRSLSFGSSSSSSLLPDHGNGDSGLGAPCLGSAMDIYFGLDDTKRALGIPLSNNFIALDNGIGFNYTTDASFVGHVYEKAAKKGLRVLVYEGDSDACGLQTAPIEDVWVPFFGNGSGTWTPFGRLDSDLGLSLTEPWRPFGVYPEGRKVQAGFVMGWNDDQIRFVSIRGAGHLAPLYRPSASFTMMRAFVRNEALPAPIYSPPSRR
eukprot:g681.t1